MSQFTNPQQFVEYLRGTLIPDLRESGLDSTADDFETAARFIETGTNEDPELAFARLAIEGLVEAGYHVGIDNGGEELEPLGPDELRVSNDVDLIVSELRASDEDYLIVFENPEHAVANHARPYDSDGWVRLVYGNDPEEVVSDYTTNLEPAMKRYLDKAV